MIDQRSHDGMPPDRELLENYVLGRLSPDERAHVDELIRTDAAWRDALERERRIADGVRHLGRKELKHRIASRTRALATPSLPWPHIFAAAAVVAILVGIGVIGRWFIPSSDQPRVTSEEIAEADEGASRSATVKSPEKSTPSDLRGGDQTAQSITSPGPEAGGPAEAPPSFRQKQISPGTGEQVTESRPVQTAGADALEADKAGAVANEAAVERQPAQQQRWTQAFLLDAGAESTKDKEAAATQEAKEERLGMQKRAESPAARQRSLEATAQKPSQSFIIDQAPAGGLSRRDQHVTQEGRQILAMVEQQRDTVRIILYLDTLFDQETLRHATVSQITTDSLVVRVADRFYGVQMPAGWQSQVPATRK